MEQKPMRLLRFFAEDQQARKQAVESFVKGGKVDVAVREKNDEMLMLLTSKLESNSASQIVLDDCEQTLRKACGSALYGKDNQTLFDALIAAMREHDKLFVAADAVTCEMLNKPLETVPQAGSVYDFGGCSCKNQKKNERIQAAGQKKADPLEAAQQRVSAACCLTGADWGATSFAQDDAITLVVGCEKGCWKYTLSCSQRPVLWLTDMLRRAALDLPQASGVNWVRAGFRRRTLFSARKKNAI